MPIQYVDNHPTVAYDNVNDKLKVNDATLEQKIDDLNTKIDAIVLLLLLGSKAEVASAQASLTALTATTYNRAAGATEIEIYCESGSIRVRTDGNACTATTGEPMGAGFSKIWAVASVSIYAVSNSVVTEVSR